MTARFIVADVFDGLATLEDGSVDLVVTSPPFLALRSYLPTDHPDKAREIGSEATPAEFIDTLLQVAAELRRVLAPHGSICVELGDTYAGSGGAGGDYGENGLREGQPKFRQVGSREHRPEREGTGADGGDRLVPFNAGPGWPLAKSKTLIPELYEIALAYGFNPLTGQESPAGRWRIRNVVDWCRPNPPVGALGDKWRPATSDVVVACVSDKRYWDDIATRREAKYGEIDSKRRAHAVGADGFGQPPRWTGTTATEDGDRINSSPHGAPLLDYWEIPPGGYPGSHYAVFPPALVEPLIKAMAPPKVCRQCGEPSRRITQLSGDYSINDPQGGPKGRPDKHLPDRLGAGGGRYGTASINTLGWSDCGHDDYRPSLILDPFAGSGTTLSVATGHGHDAIGIDLDERNLELARERIGPMFFEEVSA